MSPTALHRVPEAHQFYTGLVADLYAPLRAHPPDAGRCARLVAQHGQPALELGCGDGDPLLDLLELGLDVEGVDSSADMLERARRRAAERGLAPVLHHAAMESMELGRRYRFVFLAGPTFNLLPDEQAAARALERAAAHLEPDGRLHVPLFVPAPSAQIGACRQIERDGDVLRVTWLSEHRDEAARRQTTVLRYEREGPAGAESVERPWVLTWHTRDSFTALAEAAGLQVEQLRGVPDGACAFTLALHSTDTPRSAASSRSPSSDC